MEVQVTSDRFESLTDAQSAAADSEQSIDEPPPAGNAAAVQRLRTSEYARACVFGGGSLLLGFVVGLMGPTLPVFAQQVGIEVDALNFAFLFRGGGWTLASIASSQVYDRLPRGLWFFAFGCLLLCCTSFVVPLAIYVSRWLWGAVYFLIGAACAVIDLGTNTMAVWTFDERRLGSYIQFFNFLFGVGALLSPLLVGFSLSLTGDVLMAHWSLSVASLVLLAMSLVVISPQRPNKHKDSEQPAKETVSWLLVILLLCVIGVYCGAEVGYGGWLASYAVEMQMASEISAAYLSSVFWIAITASRLLSITLSKYLSPIAMLTYSSGGAFLTMLVLIVFMRSVPMLWVLTGVLGLFLGPVFALVVTYPPWLGLNIQSVHLSLILGGASAGEVIFPLFIGYCFRWFGFASFAFTVAAVCALQCLLLYWSWLFSPIKRSSIEIDQRLSSIENPASSDAI